MNRLNVLLGLTLALIVLCGFTLYQNREQKIRIDQLEQSVAKMAEDVETWNVFAENFVKGMQQTMTAAAVPDLDLGDMSAPRRGATAVAGGVVIGGFVWDTVKDLTATAGEKLGQMVGEWESGPPATLKERDPADYNYSTSGQGQQPGVR